MNSPTDCTEQYNTQSDLDNAELTPAEIEELLADVEFTDTEIEYFPCTCTNEEHVEFNGKYYQFDNDYISE